MIFLTTLKRYSLELKMASSNKILTIFLASSTLTMVKELIEKYIYSDWEFAIFLTILIALDTITGIMRAWKQHNFTSRKLGEDLAVKITLYCVTLITVHVLSYFTVDGKHPIFIVYVDTLALSGFMIREAISVLENISVISPSMFPTYLLKRLKMFDENGKPISPTVHEEVNKESK